MFFFDEMEYQLDRVLVINMVVVKCAIVKRLVVKDQPLLSGGYALLAKYLMLHVVNSVGCPNVERDGLVQMNNIHVDLHAIIALIIIVGNAFK